MLYSTLCNQAASAFSALSRDSPSGCPKGWRALQISSHTFIDSSTSMPSISTSHFILLRPGFLSSRPCARCLSDLYLSSGWQEGLFLSSGGALLNSHTRLMPYAASPSQSLLEPVSHINPTILIPLGIFTIFHLLD